MKFIVFLVSFSFPLLLSSQNTFDYQYRHDLSFKERVEMAERHFEKYGREKGQGYKQFKRWKYWAQKSLDHRGYVISKGQSVKRIEKFNQRHPLNTSKSRSLSAAPMIELGPTSSTVTSSHSSSLGRLLSIAVAHDNTFNHIIVASDGGGVWKTRDGGTNWTPVFETQANMEVTAVEISHADSAHYFAGLMESGLSYSTNGGTTWTAATGIASFESINQIRMHPTNASIVYAINEDPGKIYRSTNGGQSFSLLLNFGGNLFDLEFKPGSPNTMYAAGEGGIDVSTNGGTSWNAATGSFGLGTVMTAVSPADASVVYAVQASDDGGLHAVYKSTNSGNSFTSVTDNTSGMNNLLGYATETLGGQAPRDMDIIVSPTNINEVHVGGIVTHKSTTGGMNWTQTSEWTYGGSISFVHADQDAMYYVSRNGEKRIFLANDGGIYYSSDSATTFIDITAGMGIRDFYRIDVSTSTPDWVQGGSQDNGTSVLRTDGIWYDWTGADGGSVLIDHSNHLNMWATENGATLSFTSNGGNSPSNDFYPENAETSFTFPLFQHPTNAATIFLGSESTLHKSIDGGANWTTFPNFPANVSINYAEIAASDGDVIYVGSSEGEVYKTINGGANWSNVSPPAVGDFALINWIAIHPTMPNRIAIALSGADNFAKVMESTNGGTTWTDITSNLPDIGAQCVVYEGDANDGLYVGMNPGLFFKDNNSGGQWMNAGASRGLPNTSVVDVEVAHNALYMGTYGRGLWKGTLAASSACDLSAISSTPTFACVGGMKTATITWTGNDPSATFLGGSGATPASISAATGNSATFTYPPSQAFFSMSLNDTDAQCIWNYSGANGLNCTSTACTTTGGTSCGNTGHPSVAGLYNNGNSSTTYSHGGNAMVGSTIFLCGGQNFCATGATDGYGIEADTSGNFFVAMGFDGIKKLSFTSGGSCTDVWTNSTESPTGVAFKNGRLFISGGTEIIELNPNDGSFIQFWDLSGVISASGQVARIEDGPGDLLYFSDYNMAAGGFGTFNITSETAAMLPGAMGNMVKRAVGMEYANGWLLAVERGEPGLGEGKIWAIDPGAPTTPTEIASGFNDIFDVDYTTASGGTVLVADGGVGEIRSFGCSLVNTPPTTCPPSYTMANGNRITGTSTSSFDYETDGAIESNQIIISPHMIHYDSGTSIEFLPNFEIGLGATLIALIDGCGGTN